MSQQHLMFPVVLIYTQEESLNLNTLEVNKNYVYLKNLETNKIQVDLLSFKYQFK